MSFLKVKDVSKSHSSMKILDKVSIEIKKGEFISIIGPNGCGKTTLLHLISGLDNSFDGEIAFERPPKIGFVFQNPDDSFLPWKTVLENIHLDKKLNKAKVNKILKEIRLWKFRDRYPYQLSGGMKQLLSITRALIHDCDLFLLDEPFSSLDYHMDLKARQGLIGALESKKPTIIMVSHDIDDAILLSDKIIVMDLRPGKIKKTINISLPRPRRSDIKLSKRFMDYKKMVMRHVESKKAD